MDPLYPNDATDAWPLACPVCDAGLRRKPGALVCPAGHSFDVAREGYVNLLPPQHRIRGIDGDVPVMLQARRRFLESGHYQPLLEKLTAQVAESLQDRDAAGRGASHGACVLEVGCGEGYYVGNLATSIRGIGLSATFIGADLSKSAARLAAKHYPETTFIVADVHRRIYLQDGTASVLLDVFAPRNPVEFARVVEPGGTALIVIPSASHLGDLRSALGLLDIQAGKEARVLEQLGDEFRLVDRCDVSYPIELHADAVSDLVDMGPNHWHRPEGSAFAGGEAITTVASFVILRFERP